MDDEVTAEEQASIDLAIQLSLGQVPGSTNKQKSSPANLKNNTITIIDSDDDEEDDAAPAPPAKSSTDVKGKGRASRDQIVLDIGDLASDSDSATEHSEQDLLTGSNKNGVPESENSHKAMKGTAGKRKVADIDVSSASSSSETEESESEPPVKKARPSGIPEVQDARPAGSATASNIWGNMSRAEMERERLARIAARAAATPSSSASALALTTLRSTARPPGHTSSNISTLSSLTRTSTNNPPQVAAGFSAVPSLRPGFSAVPSLRPAAPTHATGRRYWEGVCKPTASNRHPGTDGFRFSDIVDNTDELKSALLTTFCGEPEWIRASFPEHVKVALVMPFATHGNLEIMNIASNMKMINPPRRVSKFSGKTISSYSCWIHLYYKSYLRVAIPTANLIKYDWTTIENAVYVHDFPRIDTPFQGSSQFLSTLIRAHKSLSTPDGLYKEALTSFDYSSAGGVRLILSLPGTHEGSKALQENGQLALARALQELNLQTPFKNLSLECQGSSIGSYDLNWIRTFYRSAMGWSPKGKGRSFAEDGRVTANKDVVYGTGEWPDLKIIYPTLETVKHSLGGLEGGGTLFCNAATWRKANFPRHLFYDSVSRRPGLLQHTKMILGAVAQTDLAKPQNAFPVADDLGRTAVEDTTRSEPYAWLYVGSHNFSPAAWGRYTEESGKLYISNHELGVLLAFKGSNAEERVDALVTWKRPVQKYKPRDIPWDQFTYKSR